MCNFARIAALSVLLAACSSEPTVFDPRKDADATHIGDASEPDTKADTVGSDDDVSGDAIVWPTVLGGDRPARLILPSGYAGESVPAILLLGGYDYRASDLNDWVAFWAEVHRMGFILVLPDGRIDPSGSPFWNATDTCCDYYNTRVDDVGYLTGLIDELEARFAVSGVALVGHSAGGFMAYRMGCEIPARLGAIVSIAGAGFLDADDCAVTDVPLSVLQVHGSVDDIMPFDGDDEAPGVLEMLGRWGTTNGCRLRSWQLTGHSPAYATEGKTYVGAYRDGCRPEDGQEDVRLWLLEDSDHYPTFTSTFTNDVLEWVLARTRP